MHTYGSAARFSGDGRAADAVNPASGELRQSEPSAVAPRLRGKQGATPASSGRAGAVDVRDLIAAPDEQS